MREVHSCTFFPVQTEISWCQLPHKFPPLSTVYGCFQSFCSKVGIKRNHDHLLGPVRRENGRKPASLSEFVDRQTVKTDVPRKGWAILLFGRKTYGRKRRETRADLTTHPVEENSGERRAYAGTLVKTASRKSRQTVRIMRRNALHTFEVLPNRSVEECVVAWLVRYPRRSKDYESYPRTRDAMIRLTIINITLRMSA